MSNFGTTNFDYRVALGEIEGWTTYSQHGFNLNVPIGTATIASFGGLWTPLHAAEIMSIVSTDANDTLLGTGAQQVMIKGVDGSFAHISEVVDLNGVTPVPTTLSFIAINDMFVLAAGANHVNAGTITATSSVSATTESEIPVGLGTQQQCMYTTSATGSGLVTSLGLTALKQAGASPVINVRAWAHNHPTNAVKMVAQFQLDTSVSNQYNVTQQVPFFARPSTSVYWECTSDKAATEVSLRWSFVEYDI